MKIAPLKYAGLPRMKTNPHTGQRSFIEKNPVRTAPRPQCGQRKRRIVALSGAGEYSVGICTGAVGRRRAASTLTKRTTARPFLSPANGSRDARARPATILLNELADVGCGPMALREGWHAHSLLGVRGKMQLGSTFLRMRLSHSP